MPPLIAGRYDVIRPLGQGAFGRTLLARDQRDARDVALKLLDVRGAADFKAFELFEREAHVLRSLRHQGIPEIYDAFRYTWDGAEVPFLAMEYVAGTSLAQTIEAGRHLEHDELMHVLLELLGILDYLHGRVPPILHRDLKPANIIIRPNGFPAVVDFGSVRRVFLGTDESSSTVAGTYGYMPYEQYMGQASPSSDLYSVAATLLHVITGRAPKDFMNADGRIEVPAGLPVDARFRDVITRMLRPSPSERFASARDVRAALLGPGTVVAKAPTGGGLVPRVVKAPLAFPPAPRVVEGVVKERLKRLSYPWWRIADASDKGGEEGYGLGGILLFGFFCVATVGILPAVFTSIARTRRGRLKRFFAEGTPALAEITGFSDAPTAFGEKLTQVTYEFEADGTLHRDADRTLPTVAARWRVGDQIEILYIADRDYDSVMISG